MSAKLIYLIRHAQPDYPGGKMMCLGQTNDLPLSPLGFEQAAQLGRFFESIELEAVYTSPLLRARQTAQAVAGDLRPLHVLPELIEMHGGEWDGLTFDQLHERYPEYFGRGARVSCPPGGESDEDGLARIHAALAHVAAKTERCAALVAHSGVNRILLCDLLGRPLSEKKLVPQDCSCFNVLAYENGSWSVKEINGKPSDAV